ncbi:MAG: UDP-N-acetylmuramate:L-alanyl-gamma-D-glutamyl-meso-diaminopimelate ligase [Gammaproteobacteria bacterium]|nr:UDP-N-acetylmuramate:L-alanyl-gamma-D-glutamyl-meso-diaminopimelate ligase [Gammaproteobacteria bacterium]
MRIYIIGICGTFMGGLARLARDMGMQVSGSDANTYPPMSTQLQQLGVQLHDGYKANNVDLDADVIVVGNTISRGNPELELVLDRGLNYTSGAQWLRQYVLQGRWVLAVAGTHGKTTTSSMLAWILEHNELSPGFLIGGVPANFNESARLGQAPFFVIEADEYDTAFSDKRSKFIHYQPRTLVLNNLEFDHADIFADLAAIQTQFHHLLKTVGTEAMVIHNLHSAALDEVLDMGCWSHTAGFSDGEVSDRDASWQCKALAADASVFEIQHAGEAFMVKWDLFGHHNMLNAVAAVAAAHHAGVTVAHAVEALAEFKSVKRRMERIFAADNIVVYDDFAHHPTAIEQTLSGLRAAVGDEHIIAVLEPRSNTMKRGIHKHLLADALQPADEVLVFADQTVRWDIGELQSAQIQAFDSTDALLGQLLEKITAAGDNCHILIMSNGGFEGLHQHLIEKLNQR